MKTFVQWLFDVHEVSQSDLNKIGASVKRFKNKDTLFNHIFGDKKRIVFPILDEDSDIGNFIQKIQKLNLPISIDDLKNGYVNTFVKTQKGSQKRKMRLSSYLQDIARNNEENREEIYDLLRNWSVVKDKLSKMDLNQGYSVIVSRYPTDILRMSDHVGNDGEEIESCHSPGKEWFRCAIKESQIGGVVAYAVQSSDLSNIDLQADEIFKDKDRNKEGIVPVERLRLRRFHNEKKGIDILIPEIKSYSLKRYASAKQVPGFIDEINKWAKSVQKNEISQIDPKEDFEDFNLRGGSYQDSGASTLWNRFFQTNVKGNKLSIDQTEDQSLAKTIEEWETRAEDMIEYHRFKNFTITSHAQQYANRIVGVWKAELEFEYAGWNFVKAPEQKDIEKTVPNSSDPEHNLSDYIRTIHQAGPPLYVILNEATVPPPNDRNYGKVSITISTSERNGSLDDFEHFLDGMDYLDKNASEINAHVEFWFLHNGFVENKIKKIFDNKTFKHFSVKSLQLTNKKSHTGVDWKYEIGSEWFVVGDAADFTHKLSMSNMVFDLNNFTEFKFIKMFHQNDPHRIIKLNDLKFNVSVKPSFFEVLRNKTYKQKPLLKTDLVYAKFSYRETPHGEESDIKRVFGKVNAIDKNWDAYVSQIKQWWNSQMMPYIQRAKEMENNEESLMHKKDVELLKNLGVNNNM